MIHSRYLTFINFSLAAIVASFAAGSTLQAQTATAEAAQAPTAKQENKSKKARLGIVKEKPTEGRFVKIEGGYMVPYKTKIPGTDISFEMVPIAGGEFMFGSPEDEDDRNDDEGPQAKVKVEPFWMGKYEVTWAEYKRYMAMERIYKSLDRKNVRKMLAEFQVDAISAPSPLYKPTYTFQDGDGPRQPAASMSQYAAKQYTKWLSMLSEDFYRLPTEAEWEYACRAGTTTPFYFGDDSGELEEHAWMIESSDEERHDVGELKPNPWGLYDMYGNVAEWVLDNYDEEGYTHLEEGETVDTKKAFNPPTDIFSRVLRGGGYQSEPEECRSASRLESLEEWKSEDPNFPQSPWWYTNDYGTATGFRLFRPLNPPKTLKEKDKFWRADMEDIEEDSQNRIKSHGKGSIGTVDPKLVDEIEALPEEDR